MDTNNFSYLMQILIGGGGLLLGVLVYIFDRSPSGVYFLPEMFNMFQVDERLFGVVGSNLPSGAHAFSFALISAGIFRGSCKTGLLICSAWFCIDTAFEIAQHPLLSGPLSVIVPENWQGLILLENTKAYLLYGTFDTFDVLSIALGAASAMLVILLSQKCCFQK